MDHIYRPIQVLVALVITAILAACGGGGGSTPPPAATRAPIANGGPAQSVVAGTLVTLDGSASTDPDNDPISYAWTLAAPTGSTATLNGASTARPTFTPDVAGTLPPHHRLRRQGHQFGQRQRHRLGASSCCPAGHRS